MGDMACQKAAQTIINEANAEIIVPAKNMFLWAGIVCVFALIPLYFLIKKGLDVATKESQKEFGELYEKFSKESSEKYKFNFTKESLVIRPLFDHVTITH